MKQEVVKPRRIYKTGQWGEARSNPHKHQKLTSSFIRSLRKKLAITQVVLGKYCGVSGLTVSRWERINGIQPRLWRWRRLRELWGLVREMKKDNFWEDRDDPPDFSR